MKYEKSKKGDGVKILDIKNKYDRVMFEISLSMNRFEKALSVFFVLYIP